MYHGVDAQASRPSWSCSGAVRHLFDAPGSRARAGHQCTVQTLFSVARPVDYGPPAARSTGIVQRATGSGADEAPGARVTAAYNGCGDTSTASICEQSDRLTVCGGRIFSVVDEMSKLLRHLSTTTTKRAIGSDTRISCKSRRYICSLIQPPVTDFSPPPSHRAARLNEDDTTALFFFVCVARGDA